MLEGMIDFGEHYLWWALGLFAASFVISLAAVCTFLVVLPAEYFQERYRPKWGNGGSPPVRLLLWVVRNLLGICLIAFGFLLSVPGIPGQGMLTILIGLLVLDVPGKKRLERAIIRRPRVLSASNRLRLRFGRPPLELEPKARRGGKRSRNSSATA